VSRVFPEWKQERTAQLTFRHCFNHIAGLPGHVSHGGLYNAYLDNAFLVQDSAFVEPLRRHRYNGDSYNLSGEALELITGKTIWRLLYENVQKPFGEPVTQLDLGFGDRFTVRYLAEVGQMLLQDGAYGGQRLYSPGFLAQLLPQRVAAHAPGFPDEKLEWGIGQTWTPMRRTASASTARSVPTSSGTAPRPAASFAWTPITNSWSSSGATPTPAGTQTSAWRRSSSKPCRRAWWTPNPPHSAGPSRSRAARHAEAQRRPPWAFHTTIRDIASSW
jgi:CubicO group peptidase (beta-lactamase class C family)